MMSRPVRFGLFAFFTGAIISFSVLKWRSAKLEMPDYGELPAFQLTTSTQQTFTRDGFLGKWSVVNFFFSHCPQQCPLVNRRVAKLAQAFERDTQIQFVSISVDPERDTPDILLGYATKMKAPANWLFLTGKKESIDTLLLQGFRLATEGVGDGTVHSFKLALVDPHARLRMFYDGLDDLAVGKLKIDLERLVQGTRVTQK